MKDSLTNRIIIGKTMGFLIGLLVLVVWYNTDPNFDLRFAFGLVLFFTLMGVLTGFMGLVDHHPIFKFKMPFWLRGGVIGAVMYLMLILLAHDQLVSLLPVFDLEGLSIYWGLAEGAVLGIIMAWTETKFAGEGKLPLI